MYIVLWACVCSETALIVIARPGFVFSVPSREVWSGSVWWTAKLRFQLFFWLHCKSECVSLVVCFYGDLVIVAALQWLSQPCMETLLLDAVFLPIIFWSGRWTWIFPVNVVGNGFRSFVVNLRQIASGAVDWYVKCIIVPITGSSKMKFLTN